MKKNHLIAVVLVLLAIAVFWMFRAGQPSGASSDATPTTPRQSAAQVEQAFQASEPEVKQAATTAADAMRKNDYERAVVSLTVIRQREDLTVEQGLAVYNSTVNLETQLIKAIEAGDQNAKRAYELLRRSKRQ